MDKYLLKKALFMSAIVFLEFLFFLHFDRANYLNKGISLKRYAILPYDTKIQGDHNCSGFYYFLPTKSNGLSLTPKLIFSNEHVELIPTTINKDLHGEKDTIYISRILQYGYNTNDMVIEIIDINNLIFWLQPVRISGTIYVNSIEKEKIDNNSYHWITPMGGYAQFVMLMWIFILIIFPFSLLYELYLISTFIENRPLL